MPRRRSTHPIAQLCQVSSQPIYVVDEHRHIVSCNPACTDWLGVPAGELIGQRCDYAAADTASRNLAAAAALCPPPATFSGELGTGWITWPDAAGQPRRRRAVYLPLGSEEPSSVFVVVGPVESDSVAAATSAEDATAAALHDRLQQLVTGMRTRYRLDRLVGTSPAIRRIREQVTAAIASGVSVLIVGPPGSGREQIARTIHGREAPQVERLLIPLDCSTADVELLRAGVSELSRSAKRTADSQESTLLLLNVDQLAAAEQAELAVLVRGLPNAVRLLATARQALVPVAAVGSFHSELAFALSALLIEVPALAKRVEDIPLLAQRMVEEHNARGGRQLAGFAPAALDRLASLPWSGNVEELALVVREACQSVGTVWIGVADLPARVRAIESAGLHPRRDPEPVQLDEFLVQIERELMERALRIAKGNKSRAARLLGVSRARLLRRLQQLGLLVSEAAVIDFHLVEDEDQEQDDPSTPGSDP